MSTERRLERLGLLHLKDDPEPLARALRDGSAEYDAKLAAWHADRDRRLLARGSQWLTLGERLGGGAYADVYATADAAHVVKIARPRDADATHTHESPTVSRALGFDARGGAFATGSFGAIDVDPNEVLACEAATLQSAGGAPWVHLEDEGEISGRRFLVLERIEGKTLRPASEGGRVRASDVLAVARSLARSSVLHGDLKPDNVMITPSGGVRLVDPSSGFTQSIGATPTRVLTTPAYNPTFATSDVPALGVMLAESLLGMPLLLFNVAVPGPVRMSRRLVDSIEQSQRLGLPTGWLRRFRMASTYPIPDEVDPRIEAVSLRALGFAWDGDTLDRATPYVSAGELADALGAALGVRSRVRLFVDDRMVAELSDGDSIVIGRGAPSTLVLADPTVARSHARVTCEATGCTVEDLASPSGIFIDDRAVRGPRQLVDGDIVGIGRVRVRVAIG